MNDEFTWPEETVSSTLDYEEATGHSIDDVIPCPYCGSKNIREWTMEEDGHIITEWDCRDCGSTGDNRIN